MKAQKKLNILLIVLIILLISIISFVGIFHLEKNEMVSMLPNYILGTNITGYRKVTIELASSKAETNSETVELGEQTLVENDTAEEESAENNTEENVVDEEKVREENAENYRKSAEIFKKRLKSLNVEDYNVTCDESSGKIEITIPENDQTETILSDLVQKGNFVISDTNSGEILLTNKDVKSVNVAKQDSYGTTITYMSINFNLSGSNKLKNITREYNENAVVEENTTDEENVIENEVQEQGEEPSEEQSEENQTETKAKTVDLKIDDTTMLTTGFSEVIENGALTLTMGSSTDEDEIKNSLYSGLNVSAIIENEPLPLDYEITGNIYVQATMQISNINIIVGVLIGIAVILLIGMIIKFKMKGLLSSILSVGYVAILLLVIRYTNVTLSLEGIFAIGLSFIVNLVFNYMLLRNLKDKSLTKAERIEKYDYTIKKYCLVLIPIMLLSVVCCFINWDALYSFGMVMFWGIVISLLYNLVVTNLLVRNK